MTDTAATRTYAYSCAGVNLASYTDSVGQTSQYTYTNHLLTTAVDPRSNTAVGNTFDSQHRVTQTTRVVGATSCVTSYAYDDVNHITTITDPLANVTKHYYDTSLRLIKILNALGGQTTFTYDSANNLLSVTNPLGKTTSYTYDSHGNRITITN